MLLMEVKRRAEESRLQLHATYQVIADAAPDAIISIDENSRNPARQPCRIEDLWLDRGRFDWTTAHPLFRIVALPSVPRALNGPAAGRMGRTSQLKSLFANSTPLDAETSSVSFAMSPIENAPKPRSRRANHTWRRRRT